MKKFLLGGAAALLASAAFAAGQFPNYPQATTTPITGYSVTYPLTGNELLPADTQLPNGLMPQTEVISTGQLAAYVGGFNTSFRNALVGGDFGTNPWQRSTSTASIANTLTYVADRWWALGGASSNITVSKQTGATDVFAGTSASYRFARTAANSDTTAICTGQVLESLSSYPFQGKTALFSFTVKAGANFSAANSLATVTIAYGTGVDGTAANFASGGWTGYTAPTSVYVDGTAASAGNVTLTTSFVRHYVAVAIPTTAAQVGVKICYTPVGTAGANDWLEFGQAQLEATSQSAETAVPSNFEVVSPAVDRLRAQRYAYVIKESAAITAVGTCTSTAVTTAHCLIQFPVTMRTVPTMSYTTGFAHPTTTAQSTLGACTGLVTDTTVASTAVNATAAQVLCTATTIPAAGTASFLYSNNGSGVITASAEL